RLHRARKIRMGSRVIQIILKNHSEHQMTATEAAGRTETGTIQTGMTETGTTPTAGTFLPRPMNHYFNWKYINPCHKRGFVFCMKILYLKPTSIQTGR